MRANTSRIIASAAALSLSCGLAACGGMSTNPTMYSAHQPVVERSSMVLDVATSADGLPVAEQRRIADWFETVDLRYGDRVSLSDPRGNANTREAVARLAGRYGLLVSDESPVDATGLVPGQARVVIVRSRASVPGCPDWSAASDATLTNGLSSNYGCATNANMAAMIANPEDLIEGQKGSPDTYINTSTAPIIAYGQDNGGGN